MILALLVTLLTRLPQLLEAKPAAYPPDRLLRGETADVACQVEIDAQGAVTSVAVEKGAAPDFDAAALAAIQQFRFSPAELDGKPAAVRIRYVYHFVLEQKAAPASAPAALFVIRGEVVEAGNRRPVAGADVSDDTSGQTSTDAQGRFQLAAPEGDRRLTVAAPGFDKREVRIAVHGTLTAPRIWLHRTEVGDLQATVAGEKESDAPTRRTLTHDELVNVPGSLNDPIRAVQNLPGLARAPFLSGQLLVRGSPPQDTGTYLDGHRIPQLYHFLGGPSVVNEQLLDRIDFYPGGYGAYYGRNLAGALDVATRKGDAQGLHGQASVDLLQSVAFAEGPLGEHTQVAVAARRSYIDLFLPLFIPNDPNRGVTSVVPIYWDYQARADHRLENGDDLSLLLFGSSDKLTVIQKGGRRTLPLFLDTRLGFQRAIATWKHAIADELSFVLSPAVGFTRQSFSTAGAGTGAFAQPQTGDLTDLTGELRGELSLRASSLLILRLGTDLQFDRAAYSIDIQSTIQLQNLGIPVTQENKFSRVQPVQQWGEYAEGLLRLGDFKLLPGLRLDQFHWREHARWSIDPRLFARYTLSDATAFKAYAGLYHEPPSGQQIDQDVGNPDLGLEWAAQAGAGVDQRLSEVWKVSAEVFYNRRGSLIVRVDPLLLPNQTVFNPRYQNNGLGRAFGLELLVRREVTARLYGFLGYTLSRSEVLPNPGDPWKSFQYDQTHIFTLVVGYRPSPSWELSSRYRLVSGNPAAPVDYATFDADAGGFVATRGNFGDARLPLFSQLDARAQYTWTWDYWQLALYLDVQNLTNHRNEEIHLFDYRYREQGSISGIPVLPTFGVKGKF